MWRSETSKLVVTCFLRFPTQGGVSLLQEVIELNWIIGQYHSYFQHPVPRVTLLGTRTSVLHHPYQIFGNNIFRMTIESNLFTFPCIRRILYINRIKHPLLKKNRVYRKSVTRIECNTRVAHNKDARVPKIQIQKKLQKSGQLP